MDTNKDKDYIKILTHREYMLYGDEMYPLTKREIDMVERSGIKLTDSPSEKQVISVFWYHIPISMCKVNDGYYIVTYYNKNLELECFLLDGIKETIKFIKR
jgi:hypothetical protein